MFSLTSGCRKLQSAEADVIKSLVVKDHALISILNKLMNRECSIIRFNHSVRHLWWWENWECQHHPIWVLLPDLWDEQGTHTRTSSSSQRVAELKSCGKWNASVILDLIFSSTQEGNPIIRSCFQKFRTSRYTHSKLQHNEHIKLNHKHLWIVIEKQHRMNYSTMWYKILLSRAIQSKQLLINI